MISNRDLKSNILFTFFVATLLHAAIFAFVKVDLHSSKMLEMLTRTPKLNTRSIKLDKINFINQNPVEKVKRVGVKNGAKNLQHPDLIIQKKRVEVVIPKEKKGSPNLSLDKLAPQLVKEELIKNSSLSQTSQYKSQIAAKNHAPALTSDGPGHFYFNPKNERIIRPSTEQEVLKNQAVKNLTYPQNKATDKISNFEIRYERPEGVSEDELNSDEKAYYSFYVRSYQNYLSKIYSNYDKIVIQKPGLAQIFDKKHLLIGKIDYDIYGNIVKVNIIKSSENDDIHYFFEETLKQLNQPNPPKIFTKSRKQFSIYYQLQIN